MGSELLLRVGETNEAYPLDCADADGIATHI